MEGGEETREGGKERGRKEGRKKGGGKREKFSFSVNNLISCMRMDKHKKILSCVLT